MEFQKYQHIERLGIDEVEGILNGKVYVFSKIDGTNCSVWLADSGSIKVASRNRVLTLDFDNAGSCAYVLANDKYKNYLEKHPNHRLFGEWLVPHTIRCYEDTAWNKLYIFDVIEYDDEGNHRYLSYEEYVPLLEEFNIEYIPVTAILENPTEEEAREYKDKCMYLVKDGGCPEGCVLKNYNYKNKYGRTIWAKVVRKQMQLSHKLHKPIETGSIEESIVNELCTAEFIDKEYAKIVNENDGSWNSKMIPKFLGCVWHTFVVEEIWNIIRKYKTPKIDFKLLNRFIVEKIKEVKGELF